MRLSVREDDPGYSMEAFGARVYLDGEEVDKCVTADEELGKVWVYDLDSLEPDMDEIPIKELSGDVFLVPGSG
jgi:hypothetical protein